jgi:hypothetical protein
MGVERRLGVMDEPDAEKWPRGSRATNKSIHRRAIAAGSSMSCVKSVTVQEVEPMALMVSPLQFPRPASKPASFHNGLGRERRSGFNLTKTIDFIILR